MAPISTASNNQQPKNVAKQRRPTRSTNNAGQNKNHGKNTNDYQKRKAESSPPKDNVHVKRSAFVDITNALDKNAVIEDPKNVMKKLAPKIKPRAAVKAAVAALESKNRIRQPIQKVQVTVKKLPTVSKAEIPKKKPQAAEKINRVQTVSKPQTDKKPPKPESVDKQPSKPVYKKPSIQEPVDKKFPESTATKSEAAEKDEEAESVSPSKSKELNVVLSSLSELNIKRLSGKVSTSSTDSSLYVSALEEIPAGSPKEEEPEPTLPKGVFDFDGETPHDPFFVSDYAMDIFNYLKEREAKFVVTDYMVRQRSVTQWMRALLVDWMVEVQESFELNHETLYLGVKLVDLYLNKVIVDKEILQLLGAAALLISSKYEERMPPLVEDFLYICDGAYNQRQLIRMECNLLRVTEFNLGIPLSYRFLRRYARCAKLDLAMLTQARYILEMSLMDYSFVQESDSKLAAAALLLALKLQHRSGWTETLQYYSGYSLNDIRDLTHRLNTMLHGKPKEALKTIRNKYSHKIFYEVAKTPLLDKLEL